MNVSTQFIFIILGFFVFAFIASAAQMWGIISTRTGLSFTEWLRLTSLGSVETRGGWVYFTCPKHGIQRDVHHGYTHVYASHTLIFGDATYCDCPQCLEEAEKREVARVEH